jgi:hypothetical protein
MAGSNTSILIKRSLSTATPSSLKQGELAYSYNSNTIFLGSPTGDGAIKIGGQYYTNLIDNATDSATGSTLVKRDVSGNASFNYITANIIGTIQGTANAASRLQNSRDFSVSGGDISATAVGFDGTGNVTLNASLNSIPGLSAGSYGSSTAIPVVTVAANGRVTSISTESISTSFTLTGDSGTTTISGGDTLTVVGGAGITSNVSGDTVTFDVDNTVIRGNTAITSQTIDGNLTIAGNLTVQGTHTTVNTATLNVADPLIILASNNASDAVDIGFAGHYNDGATDRHTGFFRDAGTKEYYVFDGYTPELSNNSIDVAGASFHKANVNAGYVKGNLIATTAVSDGFYGNAGSVLNLYPNESYAASGDQYLIVDPTAPNHIHLRAGGTIDGSTAELYLGGENTNINFSDTTKEVYVTANGINAATFANTGTLAVFGKITAAGINLNDYTQDAFNKANNSVQAATTPLTNGAIIIGAGSNNVTTLANTTYTLTGALNAANTISSLSVDAYGRLTAATGTAIAIDASQITSGTLSVGRGGTGTTSFNSGQLVIGNGTNGLQTVANSSLTVTGTSGGDKTITTLTTDAYGRLTGATYSSISGLSVTQGGTGRSTFTTNGIVYGNSTDGLLVTAAAGASDQTWSNQILTVSNTGVPVWTNALDGGTF